MKGVDGVWGWSRGGMAFLWHVFMELSREAPILAVQSCGRWEGYWMEGLGVTWRKGGEAGPSSSLHCNKEP